MRSSDQLPSTADIRAYAVAEGRILLTHDRGLARRCRQWGEAHVWLRCPEPDDRRHLESHLADIEKEAQLPGLTAVVSPVGAIKFRIPG